MSVLETLLTDVPAGWRTVDVYVGTNWTLALVQDSAGLQRAGVAATPSAIAADARFQIGHLALDEDAQTIARLLLSEDETEAAMGLATLNAINQPDENLPSNADAADWLAAQSIGKSVAVFGRFPFVDDEIRPFARQVWVFEQNPQPGEFGAADMTAILPQAEIVAITSSTIVNHTIDSILAQTTPHSIVALLGPSTPLNAKLFECGISALFGVRVVDVGQVIESVMAGEGFQKLRGLQRVGMFRSPASRSVM
jgi:uncharacterized protein (DUF4213/DUF364 family)